VITPRRDLLIPYLERLLSGRGFRTAAESTEDRLQTEDTSSGGPRETETSVSQVSLPQIQPGSTDKAPSSPPEFTQGFKLSPSPKEGSGFRLNISPSKGFVPDPENYLRKEELDLLHYLSSETSNQRPLGTSPSTETYGAKISGAGKIAFNINQIDITPWARDVVERIQKNWYIPASEENGGKNAVEITVSIGKNGGLMNLSIRNSSAQPILDQAALNAIRMSAPFPELPEDFPNDTLEVDFLFKYDE
jgi:TonB family protein